MSTESTESTESREPTEDITVDATYTVTNVHGGQEGTQARAAVLDADGVITAVVLVPGDWEDQDPATRYTPDGEVVILDSDEVPPVGAHWDHERGWVDPEPQPEPEPGPLSGQDALRRDVDALLQLILEPHAGPTNSATWAAVIAGMVERGAAGQATIDGAAGSAKVISSGARAELTAQLRARQEPDAPA